MSIFEYDEEKEIEKIRKAEYKVGYEQGHIEGRKAANLEVIRRNKEKNINVIADILNLEELYVRQVVDLMLNNPNCSDEQILEMLNKDEI